MNLKERLEETVTDESDRLPYMTLSRSEAAKVLALLTATMAMRANKDAVQNDQAACRRLYNAWRDMMDAIGAMEANQ